MSGSQKHPIVQEQKNTLRAMYLKAMACLTPRVMWSLEVEFPNPQHPKGSYEKSCDRDSQSTGEITLSCHHMVCDLLKEGFIGGRLERCSEKHFPLISVSFNYFDSSKKRKEKVEGVHAEEKKKTKPC